MSERQIAVYNQFRNAQDKHTYFILAAAGAAIAFALRETQSAALSWSQAPLAAAVLCWGSSFYCGCRHLLHMTSSLYSNFELLIVAEGLHPAAGTKPQVIAAASEGIRQGIDRHSSRAVPLGRWQFRLLILGALFYIGWHILEMWLRTPLPLLK
jgi:hypothetical protein